MDTVGKIYVDLSPDIRELLADEEVGLQDILAEANIHAQVVHEALPPEHPGERTRDLVPVIMAGSVAAVSLAASVAMVTSAISRFLQRKAARPRYVEYSEEKPVLDGKGNPLLDQNGDVQTIRVPVHKFVEPENLNAETFSVELGLATGIVVKMEAGKKK